MSRDLSETAKGFLARLSALNNNGSSLSTSKSDAESTGEEVFVNGKKSEELNVITNFFINNDGYSQLKKLTECLVPGSNVSLAAPLVEILLEIVSELSAEYIQREVSDIESKDESEVSGENVFHISSFFDECFLQLVFGYLERRNGRDSILSEKRKRRSKNLKSQEQDVAKDSSSDEDVEKRKNVVRRRPLRRARHRKISVEISKKVKTPRPDFNFGVTTLTAKLKPKPAISSIDEDTLCGSESPNRSKLPASAETSTSDTLTSPLSEVNSFNAKKFQFHLDLDSKLSKYLSDVSVDSSEKVGSTILVTVAKVLLHEFMCSAAMTNWRSVLKWCSKSLKIFSTSGNKTYFLFIVDLICSFMVLNLAPFSITAFGTKKRRGFQPESSLNADVEATFSELVSAVTKVHQISLGAVKDQKVIDKIFGCSWRVLAVFGLLWDRNRDLLKQITKKSSAHFVTNISTVKQMILIKRIDLRDRTVVEKVLCVIASLGSKHVNNDHSTSCPFKAVFDLFISSLAPFYEFQVHVELIETAIDIKLCSCQNLDTSLKFLEEFILKLEDRNCIDMIVDLITKILCHPVNKSEESFKIFKRILQSRKDKARTSLENYVLKSLRLRAYDANSLLYLCSRSHISALKYMNKYFSKVELNYETGELPMLVNSLLHSFPYDLLHYLVNFVQLVINYYSTHLLRSPEERILEMIVSCLEPKTVVLLMFATQKFQPRLYPATFLASLVRRLLQGPAPNQSFVDFASAVLNLSDQFCDQLDIAFLCFSETVNGIKRRKILMRGVDNRSTSESSENSEYLQDYEMVDKPATAYARFNNGLVALTRDSSVFRKRSSKLSLDMLAKHFSQVELEFPFKRVSDYFTVIANCLKVFHEYLALDAESYQVCQTSVGPDLTAEKLTNSCLTNTMILVVALPKIDKQCNPNFVQTALSLLMECLKLLCCEEIKDKRKFEYSSFLHLIPVFVHTLNTCSASLAHSLINMLWKFTFYSTSEVKIDQTNTIAMNCKKVNIRKISASKRLVSSGSSVSLLNSELDLSAASKRLKHKGASHMGKTETEKSIGFLADESAECSALVEDKSAANCRYMLHVTKCSFQRVNDSGQFFEPDLMLVYLQVLFSLTSVSTFNFYCDKLTSFLRSKTNEEISIFQNSIFLESDKSISAIARPLFSSTQLLPLVLESFLNLAKTVCKDSLIPTDLFHFLRLFLNPAFPRSVLLDFLEIISDVNQLSAKNFMEFNCSEALSFSTTKMFSVVIKSKEQPRDLENGFTCACWIKADLDSASPDNLDVYCWNAKHVKTIHLFSFNTIRSEISYFLVNSASNPDLWCVLYVVSKINRNILSTPTDLNPLRGLVALPMEFKPQIGKWIHVFFSVDKSRTVSIVFDGMYTVVCNPPATEEYSFSDSRDLVISVGVRIPQPEGPNSDSSKEPQSNPKKPQGNREKLTSTKPMLYKLSIGNLTVYESHFQKRFALFMFLSGPNPILSNTGFLKLQMEVFMNASVISYFGQKLRKYTSCWESDMSRMIQTLIISVDPKVGYVTCYEDQTDHKEVVSKMNRFPSSYSFPAHIKLQRVLDFETAVESLGGPNTLIYFFARIVETRPESHSVESAERDQCRALMVVLKYFAGSMGNSCMLLDENVFEAFVPIFESKLCVFSEKLVSCFVEAACEFVPFKEEKGSENDVLIKHVQILMFFFRHNSLWTVERRKVLKFYILQVQKCVEGTSSLITEFNRTQLLENEILDSCISLIWSWASDLEFRELIDCLIALLSHLILNEDNASGGSLHNLDKIEQLIFQLHPNANTFLPRCESSFYVIDRTREILVDIESSGQCELSGNAERSELVSLNIENSISSEYGNSSSNKIAESTSIDQSKLRYDSELMSKYLTDAETSLGNKDDVNEELSSDEMKNFSCSNTLVIDSGNETGGTEVPIESYSNGSKTSSLSDTILSLIVRLYTPQCLALDFSDLVNFELKEAPKFWVILFNNQDVRVSSALLNLVRKVYEIAGSAAQEDFLRWRLFFFIASQLYISHHASDELVHNALSLFFASQEVVQFIGFPAIDTKKLQNWISNEHQTSFHRESFPILLSIYLNCCTSTPDSEWHCDMANSLMTVFSSVFALCPKSRQVMLDSGCLPALMNVCVEIFQRHYSHSIQQALMRHLTEFFATVAEYAILTPDSKDQTSMNLLKHLINSLTVVWDRVAANRSLDYFTDPMNILIFQMVSYVLKVSLERLLRFKSVFNSQSFVARPGALKSMLSFNAKQKPASLQRLANLDTSDETESLTDQSSADSKSPNTTIDTIEEETAVRRSSTCSRSNSSSLAQSWTKTPNRSVATFENFDWFLNFAGEPKQNSYFLSACNVSKLLSSGKPKNIVEKLKFILSTMNSLSIFALPSKINSDQAASDWCLTYLDFLKYFIRKVRELLHFVATTSASTKWLTILKNCKSLMVRSVEKLTHVLMSPDYFVPIQTLPLIFFAEKYFEVIVKAVYGGPSSAKEPEDLAINNVTKKRLDLVCNESQHISSSDRKLVRRLELSIPLHLSASTGKPPTFPTNALFINPAMGFGLNFDPSISSLSESARWVSSAHFWKKKRSLWVGEISEPNYYWSAVYDTMQEEVKSSADKIESSIRPLLDSGCKQFLKLIESRKDGFKKLKLLAGVVNSVTHSEAVWHETEKSCRYWQLDQTEGPLRTKKRLENCMLNVNPRHLRNNSPQETQRKGHASSIVNERPGFLKYVFETTLVPSNFSLSTMSISRACLDDRDHSNNIFSCNRILPYCEISGEVLLSDVNLSFYSNNSTSIASSAFNSAVIGSNSSENFVWPYTSIREIHERLYSLKECAIEIFFTSGLSCMLAFEDRKNRDVFHRELLELHLPNLVKGEILEESLRAWSSGYLTNFAYLTAVNKFAGRSSNDLMQYPVFPFVLCDYESSTLNLQNPAIYRDLAKPVSVQNSEKEQIYESKYKEMMNNEFAGPTDFGPYHYSSLYSNSGIVLHYLVRLLPFARMFLHYQGDSFDIPDRTFFDVSSTWKLASHTSMTDVKELIPEFFYLPEFLLNKTDFDFGERQDKQLVHHVKLPPWSLSDPRLFVLVHRQALESAHVSKHLHKWIDLIFGHKQTGKAAVEAFNVYRPCLYYGFDLDAIADSQSREAVERMIRTYGQTPKQIFKSPHFSKNRSTGVQILDLKLVDFVFGGALGIVNPNDENLDKLIVKNPSSPLPSVFGLKWGNYVGSPALHDITECWRGQFRPAIASMTTILRKTTGIPAHSIFLYRHQKDLGIHEETESTDGLSVMWYGVLKFGFPDGFLRFSFRNDSKWKILMQEPFNDPVTCMCVSADSHTLFAGCQSGLVWCASVKTFDSRSRPGEKLRMETKLVPLYRMPCHLKRVNVLVSCRAYSIFVSGSDDCKAAIWDSNRNSFVRSISVSGAVKNVCISETLGDIALVYEGPDSSSVVAAYTINGDIIGKWVSPSGSRVSAITYSNAPEGISINCIVIGLASGTIFMLDSWMMNQCKEINLPMGVPSAIIALTYRSDAQILYVSFEDGRFVSLGSKELNGDQKKFLALAVTAYHQPIPKISTNPVNQKLSTLA